MAINEINIFLDKEKTEKVADEADFGIVKAGEQTIKSLFLENTIDFQIDYELTLTGDNIGLIKSSGTILPRTTDEIQFVLDPELTIMKPIRAKLDIKIKYLVK